MAFFNGANWIVDQDGLEWGQQIARSKRGNTSMPERVGFSLGRLAKIGEGRGAVGPQM